MYVVKVDAILAIFRFPPSGSHPSTQVTVTVPAQLLPANLISPALIKRTPNSEPLAALAISCTQSTSSAARTPIQESPCPRQLHSKLLVRPVPRARGAGKEADSKMGKYVVIVSFHLPRSCSTKSTSFPLLSIYAQVTRISSCDVLRHCFCLSCIFLTRSSVA